MTGHLSKSSNTTMALTYISSPKCNIAGKPRTKDPKRTHQLLSAADYRIHAKQSKVKTRASGERNPHFQGGLTKFEPATLDTQILERGLGRFMDVTQPSKSLQSRQR